MYNTAYEQPPQQQPTGTYYNQGNNQYQGGYYGNNDLPPQQTPGYVPPPYPETSQPSYGGYNAQQQDSGTYEQYSRPDGPPPAHTKN